MRIGRPRLLLGLLLLGLLVARLVPTSALLALPVVPRFLLAVTIAFFPIFGANLLRAMVGGTLEYLSLLTGYRALLLVTAILYSLAFVLARREPGREAATTSPRERARLA